MYNRYVPQADGSYRRSSMQDKARIPEKPQPPEPEKPQPHTRKCYRRPTPPPQHNSPPPAGVGGFLRNLLPKDFCTEDLLIVLLLLLMSGDCREDQNTALLTLALYLFL